MRQALFFLFILYCFLYNSNSTLAQSKGNFPFIKGSTWIYEGTHKFTSSAGKGIMEKKVHFTMKVADVINKENISVAIVENFPATLRWSDENIQNTKTLLICVGGSKVYSLLDSAQVQKALNKINDTSGFFAGLVNEGELLFDFPLTKGKVFGETSQITRSDHHYCWYVENTKRINLKKIKGANPSKMYNETNLVFITAPDTQTLEFVPGIGVTGYSYVHHGTIEELNLKLKEIRLK